MALREVDRVDQVVIRGDTYEQTVGLRGYDDVWENPTNYKGVMSFRERPDDNLTNILDIEVVPEAVPEDQWRNPDVSEVVLDFVATPTETSTFPQFNVSAYCELRLTDDTVIRRLFNSKVKVND